jgi:hypothetical protein
MEPWCFTKRPYSMEEYEDANTSMYVCNILELLQDTNTFFYIRVRTEQATQ